MSEPICRQCGGPVALFKADHVFPDGEVWARKGTRAGDMSKIDPHNYFCTMRCAARFAVAAIDTAVYGNARL